MFSRATEISVFSPSTFCHVKQPVMMVMILGCFLDYKSHQFPFREFYLTDT